MIAIRVKIDRGELERAAAAEVERAGRERERARRVRGSGDARALEALLLATGKTGHNERDLP